MTTEAKSPERSYCPRCRYEWWYSGATGPEFEHGAVQEAIVGVEIKICPAHRWAPSRQQR